MAYTKPTPDEFKTRFPAFASVDGSLIQSVLDNEVPLYLDDSWISQENYTQGAMLYTAHALTLDGHGTSAEAKAAAGGRLNYQSIRSGQLSLTRFARDSSSAAAGAFGLTSYGQRFLEILKRNSPGILAAGGNGTVPVDPWNPVISTNDGGSE